MVNSKIVLLVYLCVIRKLNDAGVVLLQSDNWYWFSVFLCRVGRVWFLHSTPTQPGNKVLIQWCLAIRRLAIRQFRNSTVELRQPAHARA
jgi:hypothetical protein